MNTIEVKDSIVSEPSDLERKQIFYCLKRLSSLTAWARILQYYKDWLAVVEDSVREADENGWNDDTSIPMAEYVLIAKGLAHFENGVLRLGNGDKRVFKFDSTGEFEMSARILDHWSQMIRRVSMGENTIKKHTPLWHEFSLAVDALAQAWGECGQIILESRYFDDPALIWYGQWLRHEMESMWFPENLGKVPDPVDSIFIRTGEYTPYSGIWEPVDIPKSSLLSLLTRAPKPRPPFKIIGAMNYLHGGSNAPKIKVETERGTHEISTAWRLLWEDDRYKDGKAPEEEMDYRFSKPAAVSPPAPVRLGGSEAVWADSGTAAPYSGRWLAEFDLNAAIEVSAGEILPLQLGRKIRWVWADSPR
jgi:Immunity protein 71/Immunity protein 72